MNDLRKAACIARAAIKSALDESFKLIRNGQMVYTQGALHDALVELNTALAQPEQEPVAWENSAEWESLAWYLCAEEHGEEACDELLYDGGPVPEPWGERWLKYEEEAKRMIALVRRHTKPVDTVNTSQERVDETAKRKHERWPDAPDVIYLQVCDDDVCEQTFNEHEVSWCEDKINDSDIKYVRADAKPATACPPCNQDCNQGRDCPARKDSS